MYAKSDVIAEQVSKVTGFSNPSSVLPSQYAAKLAMKTLHSEDVCEEGTFYKVFTEVLTASIRYGMREY